MKKAKLIIMAIALIASYSLTAQMAVTTDGSSADASAMMDVKSSDKGMLIPRMAQSEIGAIISPANGLTVFNTDNNRFYFYDAGAGEWLEMAIGAGTITPTVYNPTTGETWMDRNLGASQIATSSTDSDAYGNLYQWGRAAEGHESRSSNSTSTNATTAVPNGGNAWDGLFIIETSAPNDWIATQDNTLWQGANGTNNPCPSGFRLPTQAEWLAEQGTWSSNDAAGAYTSPLKLTVGGFRNSNDSFQFIGTIGLYTSSTVAGTGVINMTFENGGAYDQTLQRAQAFSVRCIMD